MGVQALEGNGITDKMVFLVRDSSLTPPNHPLLRVSRRWAIWAFVAIELIGFGATFAITQTIAAIGFPVFIMALIPIRAVLLPKLFTAEELDALDAPTASDFTMESCGGVYARDPYDSEASGGSGGEGVFGERRSRDEEGRGSVGSGPREKSTEGGELRGVRSAGSEGVRRRTGSMSKGVDTGEGLSQ